MLAAARRVGESLSGAFDRLPIRTRLAGVSAFLTFVILCTFALIVGSLTVHRIRSDFDRQVLDAARQLPSQLAITVNPLKAEHPLTTEPPLSDFASAANHTVIRIFSLGGTVIEQAPAKAPSLGPPIANPATVNGYRVVSVGALVRVVNGEIGRVVLQYARRVSDTEETVRRVELFLLVGVLGGTALALLAGLTIARRAMSPITELTSTAAEIARTRDPSRSVPQPQADDEVAELARTLQNMLRELESAHAETEATLARQRQFVADASHELRTPLTSVLANLELLSESLRGEQGEAASSALRSSKRMRRLVADLLLLARGDVGRVVAREPVDLSRIVLEAAAELGPVSAEHEISVDVKPVTVRAAADEMHRLVINLLENALRHTPPKTRIWVSTETGADGDARLIVQDNGPGIPEHLRATLFERFVRGAGDRGGSFGLGLAIVRAVAESHGGSVTVERTQRDGFSGGARFVVILPSYVDGAVEGEQRAVPAGDRA